MKKILFSLFFVTISVVFLFTEDKAEASNSNLKYEMVFINVDGVTRQKAVYTNGSQLYIPLRYISEFFGHTDISYSNPLISVKFDYYRLPSKYIINLNDADGKNYISEVNLKTGNVDKRFGNYKPIVKDGVTYINLGDLATMYDALSKYDSQNKEAFILYKGINGKSTNLYSHKYIDNVNFVRQTQEAYDYHLYTLKYYDILGTINDRAVKLTVGGPKVAFKIMSGLDDFAGEPFKVRAERMANFYNNKNYMRGVYIEGGEYYITIRSQTLADLKDGKLK